MKKAFSIGIKPLYIYDEYKIFLAQLGTLALIPLDKIEALEALEAQEPSSRFNYTAGITDMAELEETRRREREFFDPDEVNKEVNDRLNEILSEDFVRQSTRICNRKQ